MIGIQVDNGFLDFTNTDFAYPNCQKNYSDDKDIYLTGVTKIQTDALN